MTINDDIRGVRHRGWPPFRHNLWQRDDDERVSRHDRELDRARADIATNPARGIEKADNLAGRNG